jgi:ABC-type antimicrobial peptide transport system, ATPase component
MAKTKNILKLENVSKIYQMDGVSVKALDNVSLAIAEGEFVSIVGPSGSGKSTLMHIVGCLDTPTSGKIFLDGQEVSQMSERQLAQVRNKK